MSRILRRALCALAALASGCLPAGSRRDEGAPVRALDPSALQISVGEASYPVGGLTAPALNVELSRRGPRYEGVRWQGLTDFRMAYSYVPATDDEGCRATRPRVRVRVVTTLPAWTDRDAAPEALRADWDLYLGRLREHEEGHQRIAIDGGESLFERVAALRARDCDALRLDARAVLAALEESVAREQRGWDVATGHGLARGEASF